MAGKSIIVLLTLGLVSGCAGVGSSACDRNCLVTIADSYLAAIVAHDPAQAPLADDIVFVENITPMTPGEGVWEDTVGVSGSFRINIVDEQQGSIGLYTIINREDDEGEKPALLAARLKVRNGLVTEAEHLVDEVPPAAGPNLQAPRAHILEQVPEGERMSRRALARIAASYYDALDLSDGSLAPFAEDCQRQENGMITAGYGLPPAPFESVDVKGNPPPPVARDCIGQMNSRRFAYIDSIDNRRIVAVDPEYGLAMGWSHFRQSMNKGPQRMIAADGSELMWEERREPYDLPAAHIFKITDGEIHEVEALGIFVPYYSPTGWE